VCFTNILLDYAADGRDGDYSVLVINSVCVKHIIYKFIVWSYYIIALICMFKPDMAIKQYAYSITVNSDLINLQILSSIFNVTLKSYHYTATFLPTKNKAQKIECHYFMVI